jgi:hypothetical protein
VLSLLFGHLTSKRLQLLLSVLLELQECPHTLLESASLTSNSKLAEPVIKLGESVDMRALQLGQNKHRKQLLCPFPSP